MDRSSEESLRTIEDMVVIDGHSWNDKLQKTAVTCHVRGCGGHSLPWQAKSVVLTKYHYPCNCLIYIHVQETLVQV